ncbi:hypothetical protein QEN19_002184 [Hanseniaspora menglaensis]
MSQSHSTSTGKTHFLKIKRLSSMSNSAEKENKAEINTMTGNKRPQFFKSFSASSVMSNTSSKQLESSPLKKVQDSFSKNMTSSSNKLIFENASIFNSSLRETLKLASAEVVLQNDSISFGRIPLIVAKCGSILKKNALKETGIFRIAGNTKKIKLLQQIFSTPPKYGHEWKFDEDILPNGFKTFSVHDISGVLRRFLNNMDEPLIPLTCYDKFRKCLKENEVLMKTLINKKNNGGKLFFTKEEEIQLKVDYLKLNKLSVEEFNENLQENKRLKDKLASQRILIKEIRVCLKRFEKYIKEDLEDCNKETLIYLLDLLFLFSQYSDKNLMDSKNLAAIFQPSVISHPDHDMNPKEYELSRIVLEFLINFSYKLVPNVFNISKEQFKKQNMNVHEDSFKCIKPTSIIDAQNSALTTSQSNLLSKGRRHSKSLSITMNDRENMELLRVVNKSETETEEDESSGNLDAFNFENAEQLSANNTVATIEDFGNNTTIDNANYDAGNITMSSK